jgi:hypothetical protein
MIASVILAGMVVPSLLKEETNAKPSSVSFTL